MNTARWKTYAFEIARRPSKVGKDVRVAARRVLVSAPSPEAARAGAGPSRDELLRECRPRLGEALVAGRGVAREEVAEFYDTIGNALMTGAGMTAALNMAARMARTARMRGVVGSLQQLVGQGDDLHAAMRRFPRVFDPMQLAMVEAAGASGLDRAGRLLVTLSHRMQKDARLWRRFLGALAYPASLLGLTIVGAVVLEIWALPPMVELFRTLGGRLPPITAGFYQVAQFLRLNGPILLPAVIAAIVLAGLAAPRLRRSAWFQRLSVRLWLIGPVVQWIALVRALGTFVLLKQSGAKVRDQFALAAATAGNCVVSQFFEACYARIAAGESIEEAFAAERHRLGDDGVRIAGKMEMGMVGADLPTLLNRIVADIDDRAEMRLNALPHAVRWPLLIVCCAIIGTVALAIVLPYPNLIADVAGQQAAIAQ